MKLTIHKHRFCCVRLTMLIGLLLPVLLVLSDEMIERPEAKPDLPDFTRTYGFDIRPDVTLLNDKNRKSRKKGGLKAMGSKLKNRLQKKQGDNLQYGVQKFMKYTGKRRYGIGIKRKNDDDQTDNLTLHGHGISYDRHNKNYKYYMGLDTRNPVDTKEEKEANYMYFGIKANW